MRFSLSRLRMSLALVALTTPFASLATAPLPNSRVPSSVSDELQPFLTKNFGQDERILRSVSNMVISYDYALASTTLAESSRAHAMHIRSEECLISLAESLHPYVSALTELDQLMMANPERAAAYAAHLERLQDLHFAKRNAAQWEDWCMQRVDQQ